MAMPRLPAAPIPAARHHTYHPSDRLLPVGPELAALLPQRGLQRGTVNAVLGSAALLICLLAEASRRGAWAAAVGFPEFGVVAASDAGWDLARLALVPQPGPDAVTVIGALIDGMDIVIVGGHAVLLDADRRRIGARARERGAIIVSAGSWPGAHIVLQARAGSWAGPDHGVGWLRRRAMVVERTGRAGAAQGARVQVELPVDRTTPLPYLREIADATPVAALVEPMPDAPDDFATSYRSVPSRPSQVAYAAATPLAVVAG